MSIESDTFLRCFPDFNKLKKYGFIKKEQNWLFEKSFANDEFKAIISISAKGNVTGFVYDVENNDEFLPIRIEHNEGSFAGKIRKEYTDILTDIKKNCFSELYFVSQQGNRITDMIKNQYGDSPLFLWDDTPNCGVFKNPETGKWYGIIMYINRKKLGEPSEEMVEVLNIKLDKDRIPLLLKKDGIYPAYHMNKKYWITITLDETLSDKDIMEHVQESHKYTIKKRKII